MALSVQEMGQRAKKAIAQVAGLSLATRNTLLKNMGAALLMRQDEIIAANQQDLAEYGASLSRPMQKRLTLDSDALTAIAE